MKAMQQSQGEQLVLQQTRQQEASGNIASLQQQLEALRQRLAQEPRDLAQARVLDNPLRADLEEALRKLQVQRTTLLETFQPDSDDVKSVDGEIKRLERRLATTPLSIQQRSYAPNPRWDQLNTQIGEVEGALTKSRQDYAQASSALVEQVRQSNMVEPWEIRLTTLTEDRDLARLRFTDLSSKLQGLEFRLKSDVQPLRVLERAEVPTVPVQPNRPMLLVLSSVFAVLLATGIAFLVEYMDDRLNESEDVQRLFALPTLAHVPQSDEDQAPVLAQLPAQSHLAEAYRALRSSIEFAGIDSAIHCLQITSASKGEGKSTTALNLATAMAMAGKRVILVDADLRRPAVHRMLEISSTPGLTDVLIGTATLDEVIRETETENLRIICAGAIPPNPTELLASNAFAHILEQLEARADLVMVDTPPCAPVTDPIIVAARMDAVLLVVNAGHTRKPVLSHALEMLGRARARVIGVVLNRVDGSQKGYYYYQYGGYTNDGPETRKRRRRSNGHEPRPLGMGTPVRSTGTAVEEHDAN
jgi:capsular exopolysaccharide synthesis family protein